MAYTFIQKPAATIKAKITGTDDSVSVQGTNPAVGDPEVAKAAIDKILAVVGNKTVTVEGMTQTISKEAVNNG